MLTELTKIEKENIDHLCKYYNDNFEDCFVRESYVLSLYRSFKRYLDSSTKDEIIYFKDMLNKGRVNGKEYKNRECLCYVGYLAKNRGINYNNLIDNEGNILAKSSSTFEFFLYDINIGDTPINNNKAFIVNELINIYLGDYLAM